MDEQKVRTPLTWEEHLLLYLYASCKEQYYDPKFGKLQPSLVEFAHWLINEFEKDEDEIR